MSTACCRDKPLLTSSTSRAIAGRDFSADERSALDTGVLRAYRWQYIITGVQHPHFMRLLTGLTTPEQLARIVQALTPIMQA